ncbi:hypothetical protein LCGC14_1986180 [marine sediment metagenome]|uniref:Uncharacterized protein n=1 Tax=marine sediment metagenome TaxID=412755 RepID=A0A0F9I4L2_9ZZZZ
MKLKMLHKCTFANGNLYANGKLYTPCILRWQFPKMDEKREGFYVGDKLDDNYTHLNTPLKRLL